MEPIQQIQYSDNGAPNSKLSDFLNYELRPRAQHSIFEEYPALFGNYPGGHSLYIEVDGQIVSHVAFVVREYQHRLFRMRVGLIGSVATAHAFRGRGMASSLLKKALNELKIRGACLGVLWSEQSDFYLPLGFYRAGKEVDLKFQPRSMPEAVSTVRPVNLDRDLESLWRLYHRHECKVDRSLEEMKRLCRIPETKLFVTERDGIITSYIAINKGADFTGYIHEWAGDLSEVQRNIGFCQATFFKDQPLTLIAPSFYDLGPIKQIAEEKWEGVLGLVRLLDKNYLLSSYVDYMRKLNHTVNMDKFREVIEINGKKFPIKTDSECLKTVLGDEMGEMHPVLPLFLWGFDSI